LRLSAIIYGRVWDLELDHSTLVVLLAYADHSDHNGEHIYPSVALMAWKTGYSERQIQRISAELVRAGLLVVDREGGGAGQPTMYRIVLAAGKPKMPFADWQLLQNGDKMSPFSGPKNGDKMSPFNDVMSPNGDILAENGDIAMSPESLTVNDISIDGKWDLVLTTLRLRTTKSTFEQWLAKSAGVCADGKWTVYVQDERARQWCQLRLSKLISESIQSVTHLDPGELSFVVRGR
jgi:hypothetical protein